MITRVLHLSDLHFGARDDPSVERGIAELVERVGPELLIASGDLTHRGRRAQHEHAAGFLRGLGTFVWTPEYGVALRFLALFTLPLFVIDLFNESRSEEYLLETSFAPRRLAVGIAMMTFITLLAANQLNAFIYFQF